MGIGALLFVGGGILYGTAKNPKNEVIDYNKKSGTAKEPKTETDDYKKKSGDDFEKFIAQKFNLDFFTIKEWAGDEFVSGKLDYFPLSDETKRAIYGGDLIEEEKVRLLLNPCVENPELLIQYNSDGEILPLTSISNKKEEMVETSIMTYGLNRSTLHKKRREKWLLIEGQILII